MHELKLRAADYMHMEEMKTLQTKFRTDLQPVERNAEKAFARANPRPKDPKPARYSRYAPLSASRSRILKEALQTNLIPEVGLSCSFLRLMNMVMID